MSFLIDTNVISEGMRPEPNTNVRAWIDAGPSWPDEFAGAPKDARPHWSLTSLVKPALPSAGDHPIDRFIGAKLAEKGLARSREE